MNDIINKELSENELGKKFKNSCLESSPDSEKYLTEIYKRYHNKFYRVLLRSLQIDDVEDIISFTFESLIESIHNYNEDGNFSAWFWKIMINNRNDFIRRYYKYKNDESLNETFEDGNEKQDHIEDKRSKFEINLINKIFIEDLLKNLSSDERELIYLRFYENLEFHEMEDLLGIKMNTIQKRIERIIEKLRKILSQM